MQAPPSVFLQSRTPCIPVSSFAASKIFQPQAHTRGLSEYDHLLALCFGQLTYRDSLRDIVACLSSKQSALYHLGFRGRLSRTNLAYANYHRDWRVFEAVAQLLMRRAARLYQRCAVDPDLPAVAFALDSSLIALNLKLFCWGYGPLAPR